MKLSQQVVRFALGGVLGFLVDAGLLHVLMRDAAVGVYPARVVSFVFAASTTWLWNRTFTFAHRRHLDAGAEWSRWLAVMGVGALLNYTVFAALVAWVDAVRHWPVLGVAAGSGVAAVVNFGSARKVVFNKSENMP